jgi:hypothetical protein
MRIVARFILTSLLAGYTGSPVRAQTLDDSLRIYAVNILKTPPFQIHFTGYGTYLGEGMVITAAHVVGQWPSLTRPRILIGGQDLPAKIVKEGSFEGVDLALLSVDAAQLPVSLRLRRNPLCKGTPKVGTAVIDVVPDATSRARTISALLISPALQRRFNTLINTPEGSGSGLFDAEQKCFLGVVSAKLQTVGYRMIDGHIVATPTGYAGYYVSAAKIAAFVPQGFPF